MAITSDQKIDFLWKKLGFKAAKTDISSVKGGPNEAIPAVSRINSSVIWAQSGDIPGVQPSATAGVVTVYSDGGSSSATVECTEDATATSQRSWKTGLTDWIDTSYGSTYLVKVYADDAGQTDPETGGTQLLGGESGYEWFFDYDAGVLNFIGTSIPGALSGKKIYVKGSRYTGNTGVPESGAGDTATNVQFDPTNLNDIQSTDTDGNINLDPNGTGNVVVEGTNSLVLPVGTTVERDASPTQGGVRYNTTTSSFEGYSGSAWGSLGGLIDIDQDTYICAEVSSDSDDLEFYTAGTKQLCIDQTGLITATSCIVGGSRIISDSTTNATTGTDGSIQTDGGLSVVCDVFAAGKITATGRLLSDSTTNATDTTDGSIQTDGGLSVVCDGYIGGQVTVTGKIISDSTTNATTGTDGSIQTDGGISAACDVFAAGKITATGRILTNDTTNATTGTDGALQTDGGLSAACDVFAAGKITATGRIISDSTTNATTGTDGALQTDGGISAACDVFAAGKITATGRIISDSTTDATSGTDGSIQTDGGISSAKAIFGGTTITATGRILSDDTTDATSGTDGSIQTDGGISSAKAIFSGTTITATGRILTDDTTNATSTTNGALQSDGGLSVACDGYFGGNIVIKDTGTIGSASDTDAIAIDATGNVSVSQDLTVTGDFTVSGTNYTIDSTTMTVVDPIIHLQTASGGGALAADTNKDVGLAMQYHNGSAAKTAFLGYDDSTSKLIFIPDATLTSEVASGVKGTIVAHLEGNVTGDLTGNADTVTTNANLTGGVTSVGNAATVVTNANLTGGVTSVGNAATVVTNANLTGGVTSVGNAATVVTNANLTGDVTSSGNATTISGLAMSKTALSAGTGLTLSTNTLSVNAAQTQITSVGTLTALTVDNVKIDSTNIGHTSDTDLMALASGVLTVNGEVRATGEITAYYSDRRLKEIEPDGPGQDVEGKDAADVLKEISGVYYKNNDEAKLFGYDSDKRQIGLIAQEVQKILPEVVVPAPFDIAEDGSSKSGENFLTIKYEKVIPLLVNAINAQTSKIQELKEKIDELTWYIPPNKEVD